MQQSRGPFKLNQAGKANHDSQDPRHTQKKSEVNERADLRWMPRVAASSPDKSVIVIKLVSCLEDLDLSQ